MSLSSRTKNKLMDNINTTFNSIGHANGMRMPKSDDNRESLAWELFVAQHVASLANKRKDLAERNAATAGVINNKEKDPRPAGTREIVYNGNVVNIALEVSQPATRISASAMADYLLEYFVAHKMPTAIINAALAHATTTNKPAHVFKSMLVVDNDDN